MFSAIDEVPARTLTPVPGADLNSNGLVPLMPEASTTDLEEDARRSTFSDLYRKSEARVAMLFSDDGRYNYDAIRALLHPPRRAPSSLTRHGATSVYLPPPATDHTPIREPPLKKAKRAIDEDDYDDDDDDEAEEPTAVAGDSAQADQADLAGGSAAAPPDAKSTAAAATANGLNSAPTGPPRQLLSPSKSGSSPVPSIGSPEKHSGAPTSQPQVSFPSSQLSSQTATAAVAKTAEDVRKELEEARNATEMAARRSFHTLFYTLEHDRIAMLEQQQLEESEKQIQAELEKNGANGQANGGAGGGANGGGSGTGHGTLSSANLGASSLTLKHLIARIDMKRDQVKATDTELRSLINEVRKNRSKWASEENVGQEELYEALEKVLSELKAHTEYSTPFLQRVNKREAPDYHLIVKQPMDLGTMTKKLKGLQYKSKAEFVVDLNLVWDNCLKYNRDTGHPLRRMANSMRREAEKLIPLIPNLVIRSRAEVEAEERRKQNGGEDGGDDDSDDEPIMSSRGRTAGTKGVASKSRGGATTSTNGGTGAAGMDPSQKEGTPSDQKPVLQLNGVLTKGGREGSEVADSSNGFGTPLGGSGLGSFGGAGTGSLTPGGFFNNMSGVGSSTADAMELDGSGSINGMALNRALNEAAEQAYEDEEDLTWKQVTKKSRALLTRQRYEMFKNNKLNVDQPALLRSKANMRWFLKGIKEAEAMGILTGGSGSADSGRGGDGLGGNGGSNMIPTSAAAAAAVSGSTGLPKKDPTTLAEGMNDELENMAVPDYYEPESIVPAVPSRVQWIEDDEGAVINPNEEFMRLVPAGHFVAPPGKLSKRFDDNMRQIQETRKICSKIGVVKQMQIQTQNQFQRYDPEPFCEADIESHVVCGDGALMAGEACRAALQRSVAKIFFHAGFEELQPSAMDAMTDIAADYFTKLCQTFNVYHEAERKEATGIWAARGARFQPRYTPEEVVLHTLHENGHDLDGLDSYVRDDVERLGGRLGVIHERMKAHLSDLLRPALQDGGTESFHDGSEQFVGGDFADELGEDFFGFKALGLDKELGLDILSVPLHLLQSRVRSQNAVDVPGAGTTSEALFPAPPPLEPVTRTSIVDEIGLVKNFFLAKLHANGDEPLVEDEDLPVKQRRPRPRLGATGKIVSPQKRPPKEQIALAKKKKREAIAAAAAAATGGSGGSGASSMDGMAGTSMVNGAKPILTAPSVSATSAERASPVKKAKTSISGASGAGGALKGGAAGGAANGQLSNGLGGLDTSAAGVPLTGFASMERTESSMSQDIKDDMSGPMSPESIAQ